MVTACTSFQNGFAPPEADINGVVKTCFENIRANTDPDEYNKMINLPIKQWGNKSVEELLECIPAGEKNETKAFKFSFSKRLVRNKVTKFG